MCAVLGKGTSEDQEGATLHLMITMSRYGIVSEWNCLPAVSLNIDVVLSGDCAVSIFLCAVGVFSLLVDAIACSLLYCIVGRHSFLSC